MQHSLTTELKKIGLGDYEALVYGALAEHSPATATFLAKKCGLSRSSVYTTLSSLVSKSLVGTGYKNQVKQFVAEGHVALEQFLQSEQKKLKEKFEALKTVQSSLEALGGQSGLVPHIVFFEGQEGLKKIYLSMMRAAPKNSVMYIARDEFIWQPEWKFVFEMEWQSKIRSLKMENNIRTKLLVNNSATERAKEKLYKTKKSLQYRFLPTARGIADFAVYILGDTTAIMSMQKNNLAGIHISNQHMTDNFKSFFEILWEKSRDTKR